MTDASSTKPQPDRAPIRRVVTGHTPEGKSTVIEDAHIPSHPLRGSETLCTEIYWTDQSPPSNEVEFKDLAKDHPNELFPPVGSSLIVVETPPGLTTLFYHRTVSLDYGIVTHGQLTLVLDDNKRVVVKPGDVFIQRGTIHGWLNEGTEWVRMYCTMLPSQKVKIGDKELEAHFPSPPKK